MSVMKMRLQSGLVVDPGMIQPHEIRIVDLASALSQLCRFTGHCGQFYSVAEHSVHVCHEVLRLTGDDREAGLCALLHDAPEAYLGDVSRPVRAQIGDWYHLTEARVMLSVVQRFGLPDLGARIWQITQAADDAVLDFELLEFFGRDSLAGPTRPGPEIEFRFLRPALAAALWLQELLALLPERREEIGDAHAVIRGRHW